MAKDPFSLASYQYDLPQELIAQFPCTPRDSSRLLVIDRQTGSMKELVFRELKDLLQAGDSLVFNDTKVIPARLVGLREGGGKTEVVLIKRLSVDTWEVLAKPGRKLRPGSRVVFGDKLSCLILETLALGTKIVRFQWVGIFEDVFSTYGRIPLPHYIERSSKLKIDEESYQTVYAANAGAVAAPTAGLHFTQALLDQLSDKRIGQSCVTLHIGLGTFKPVQTEDIRAHAMHSESFIITPETAQRLNARSSLHRQICVGTTCCRTLESAADSAGKISPGQYETDIFIYPGYQFKYVQALLTNFHLPCSTLLMLVCAFAGYDLIMQAYAKAIKERFRFYSYGDAMLIL